VPGLAIVYFHNRWTGGWPVLVTVMGWLSLVVGLLRMVFPTQMAAMATKLAPSAAGVFPAFAVVFLASEASFRSKHTLASEGGGGDHRRFRRYQGVADDGGLKRRIRRYEKPTV
jgi:hypothetical protein